jgi:hypothetical protein
MNGFDALLRLMRDTSEWIGVRWSLFDIQVIRRDPMHEDLPGLIVKERLLRP